MEPSILSPLVRSRNQTVADLQSALSALSLPSHSAYLREAFIAYSGATPLSVAILAEMVVAADRVRRRPSRQEGGPQGEHQLAYHSFTLHLLKCCAPLVAEACSGHHWLKNWASLSTILESVFELSPADFFGALDLEQGNDAGKKWRHRDYIRLQQVRNLFDLGRHSLQTNHGDRLALVGDRLDAKLCVQQLLQSIGRGEGEDAGHGVSTLPPSEKTAALGSLAADHAMPDLIRYHERCVVDAVVPPKHLSYVQRAAQCAGDIDRVFKWEAQQPHRPRAGKRDSSGELAPASKKGYRQLFGHALVAADHVTGRQSVLLDIFSPECVHALRNLLQMHTNGEMVYGHAVFYRKLADYSGKPGAFWALAPKLIEQLTEQERSHLEHWTPRHWPDGADSPGTECETLVDRFRAGLLAVHDLFGALARLANAAPYSRSHLRELAACPGATELPMTLLFQVMLRLEKVATDPRNPHQFHDAMVLAYLGCAAFNPPRVSFALESEGLWLETDDEDELLTMILGYTTKNPRGTMAAPPPPMELPVELTRFFRPYDALRRSQPTPLRRYLCERDGRALSPEKLRVEMDRAFTMYAADIFPFGLKPHTLRTLVATHLVACFGWEVGLQLAAKALRIHDKTVVRSYVVLDRLPLEVDLRVPPDMATTVATAIAAAIKAEAKASRSTP